MEPWLFGGGQTSDGSSEWIFYFALLVHMAFALLVKLSLSELMSFYSFSLSILSSIPCGEVSQQLWKVQLPTRAEPRLENATTRKCHDSK